jgi:hypothetical protein
MRKYGERELEEIRKISREKKVTEAVRKAEIDTCCPFHLRFFPFGLLSIIYFHFMP